MVCELLDGCAFLKAFKHVPVDTIEIFKKVCCCKNPELCACWQAAAVIDRKLIPPDLSPDQTHRVHGIIRAAQSDACPAPHKKPNTPAA